MAPPDPVVHAAIPDPAACPGARARHAYVPALRALYPERELFQEVSDNARLIVSEPLGDVAGVWNEVPESTYGVVGPDHAEMQVFRPKPPTISVPVTA